MIQVEKMIERTKVGERCQKCYDGREGKNEREETGQGSIRSTVQCSALPCRMNDRAGSCGSQVPSEIASNIVK